MRAKRAGFWLDPRTKGVLLILCILSAALSPSIAYNWGLVFFAALLAVCFGKYRFALMGAGSYLLICFLTQAALGMELGTLQTMLIAAFGLFHKVYPCGMLSGVLLSTTKVGEFLCAMEKIHAPRTLTVAFAVMLRYIPTIREDWHAICDAMRLRDISPSLPALFVHPARTVECIYVPLMMAASRAADELSIAAVTRGIENPKDRTCLIQIGMRGADKTVIVVFLFYFLAGQLWKEVFL